MPRATSNLSSLEERALWELECLGYPSRDWVLPRAHDGKPVLDALIIGGGQSGIAIAFRLMRERVTNIHIVDQNPPGAEGPWKTFARMSTLRTPKTVIGPELGIPSLSVQAWYEASFGQEAWAALGKIPRETWHEYLMWVRSLTGISVSNHMHVTDIEPLAADLLAVHASHTASGTTHSYIARNAVLATGIEGCGRWAVPPIISRALPRSHYAHTSEPIAFAALKGKRVAVIGAGASAFDNAACALEAGAAAVDLFVRRKTIPTVNPNRWIEFAGFLRHYADLDDGRKWRFMKTILDMNQPPPQDTFERCSRFRNFEIHTASPVEELSFLTETLRLKTPSGRFAFDFLIAGTGFTVDFDARPELARFASKIALWRDRYTPPPGWESEALGGYPYLSPNFQFMERVEGEASFLKLIFSYTYAAMPSLACSAGISQLKFGVDRVAQGITRNLFAADADRHFAYLLNYDDAELTLGGLFPAEPSNPKTLEAFDTRLAAIR